MTDRRIDFLGTLEGVIRQRIGHAGEESYTARLAVEGIERIAQKLGEEGIEVALAAVCGPDDRVVSEAADLLYHLIVLLAVRGMALADVVAELESRHRR